MAAPNPNWLWNPYTALDLHSLLDTHSSGCIFSCTGYAVSRDNARCRNPISRKTQLEAREKLDSMAVAMPSSQAVTRILSELVHLLLCKQVHQVRPEQREARFSHWSAKIRDVSHWSGRIRDIAVEIDPERGMLLEIQQLKADLRTCQEAQRKLVEEQTAFSRSQTSTSSRIMNLERELDVGKTELQKVRRQLRQMDKMLQNHQSPATAQTFTSQCDSGTNLQETRRPRKESKTTIEKHQSVGSSKVSELKTTPGEAEAHTSRYSDIVSNPNAQLQRAATISATYEVSK